MALVLAARGTPAVAQIGAPPPQLTAGDLLVRAIGNEDITYTATRTSIFWARNGKTRALVARIYRDRRRVRYEYPARGNQPARAVVETNHWLYFIDPAAHKITRARRQRDFELDGVRVKLALANYIWRL